MVKIGFCEIRRFWQNMTFAYFLWQPGRLLRINSVLVRLREWKSFGKISCQVLCAAVFELSSAS